MTLAMELRDVRVRYGPLEALHGVRLPVPAGALTVLLGRNGSGRTTALRALAGTVLPAAGSVLWQGRDVTALHAYARARLGLCFVPDQRAVYGTLTVAENLELAAPRGEFARALEGFPALRPLLGRTAATLSGGEQRMLALSRALLTPAAVVLADEPVQGMAPAVADRAYGLLRELGAAVVVAEQRLPEALRHGGPPVVVHELRCGSVVFSGEPAELAPVSPGPGGAPRPP